MPEIHAAAPPFTLPSVSGDEVSLSSAMGPNGLVVAFICNHCPYVVAAARRMVEDANTLNDAGVGFAAICANDATRYPADSFDRMKVFATDYGFSFPYLHDESQAIAQAYKAAVTPEFFGISKDGTVLYRGRLDGNTSSGPADATPRDLVEAMNHIVATGTPPDVQHAARGCSIKWKG
ncbi:MAG: thioredoxin family protein [Pseudomonadota bacterium]